MENINRPHTPIKDWAEDDRPREKMLRYGPGSLGLSELLAILINNGSKRKSAIDLARDVMQLGQNNLHQMARLGVSELQKVKGIGPAKAIVIKAALELAVRKEQTAFEDRPLLAASNDVRRYLQKRLQDEEREVFLVVFLNRANKVIRDEIMSTGGMHSTVVDVRIILRRALEEKACGIILSHNHPSGSCRPSLQDRQVTRKIKDAALLMDILVIDHVIISEDKVYSFADEGEL